MVVDLMHDVEIGVEKQVLLHHLRTFNAMGKGTIEEFDARFVLWWCQHNFCLTIHSFRQVPTFGRDTIRRFGGNVSALKRPAAWSFEDILQVNFHITH
jgi:hypothetical protein